MRGAGTRASWGRASAGTPDGAADRLAVRVLVGQVVSDADDLAIAIAPVSLVWRNVRERVPPRVPGRQALVGGQPRGTGGISVGRCHRVAGKPLTRRPVAEVRVEHLVIVAIRAW